MESTELPLHISPSPVDFEMALKMSQPSFFRRTLTCLSPRPNEETAILGIVEMIPVTRSSVMTKVIMLKEILCQSEEPIITYVIMRCRYIIKINIPIT